MNNFKIPFEYLKNVYTGPQAQSWGAKGVRDVSSLGGRIEILKYKKSIELKKDILKGDTENDFFKAC